MIGGTGSRKRSKRGSPNAAACASAMLVFLGTWAIGATPNMRRSRAGATPDPHENTPTVSKRDHTMSVSEAMSIADLPVVPLEQDM